STFARSTAARTTWPPIVAPWVMLSAPRQLFASPVRAVETITASTMVAPREARGLAVVHGPAAECREAVAGEIDDIDVGGARRDALVEDLEALRVEGAQAARDDFLLGDLARRDAHFLANGSDHLVDHRVGDRVALAGLVALPAR